LEAPLEFAGQHWCFVIQDCHPSAELGVLTTMMLQSRNREGTRVSLPIKQKRFTPAKVRRPRTQDCLGKMPIAVCAVVFEFG
jgi:hypothetical protein